jgi:hypothetical protein
MPLFGFWLLLTLVGRLETVGFILIDPGQPQQCEGEMDVTTI